MVTAKRKPKQLGQILLEQGLLTDEQLDHALEEHRNTPKSLGRVLIDLGYIKERDLVRSLAEQVGLEFVDLSDYRIDAGIATLIPEPICRRYRALAIGERFGLEDERIDRLLGGEVDLKSLRTVNDIVDFIVSASAGTGHPTSYAEQRVPPTNGER